MTLSKWFTARKACSGQVRARGSSGERTEGDKSELTEREPDPNKKTNKCSAEVGREGKAKGKEGRRKEGGERQTQRRSTGRDKRERARSTQKGEEKESSRQVSRGVRMEEELCVLAAFPSVGMKARGDLVEEGRG